MCGVGSVVHRMAGQYDHLYVLGCLDKRVSHPGHPLGIGLRQLIIEDDERLEGFPDGQPQQ